VKRKLLEMVLALTLLAIAGVRACEPPERRVHIGHGLTVTPGEWCCSSDK